MGYYRFSFFQMWRAASKATPPFFLGLEIHLEMCLQAKQLLWAPYNAPFTKEKLVVLARGNTSTNTPKQNKKAGNTHPINPGTPVPKNKTF